MMSNVTMVRIYLREGDHHEHHNLMDELFALLHGELGVLGITVYRAVAGFGSRGEVHADDLLRLGVHLPLIVEFFDDPETVRRALQRVAPLLPSAHIVHWDAHCPSER